MWVNLLIVPSEVCMSAQLRYKCRCSKVKQMKCANVVNSLILIPHECEKLRASVNKPKETLRLE